MFAAAFLFNGFNVPVSAYFTALGNAKKSAAIAAMRGLFLASLFVLTLPRIKGNTESG